MNPATYTRVVSTLKIILPLIALVLLGTVFLITPDDGFDTGFSFTQADFDALEEGNGLTNPRITGKTAKGQTFNLTAARISPQAGDIKLLIATDLAARLDAGDGRVARIDSEVAMLDLTENTLSLSLGGHLRTSEGYDAQVETLYVDLNSGDITGGRIRATGKLGEISADSYRILVNSGENGENRMLWFENNVRVTISTVGQAE